MNSILLKYLGGYPEHLLLPVNELIQHRKLGSWLEKKYPEKHSVQNDGALFDYVSELKSRYMKNAASVNKVYFDNKLSIVHRALGLNVSKAHIQGNQIKRRREIIVAGVFREAAPEFLRMIVVHELAHLREQNHDKSFYQLCTHMEPAYHQLEFDFRLYLIHRELAKQIETDAVNSTKL